MTAAALTFAASLARPASLLARLDTPRGGVVALILTTCLARLAFAGLTGLGIDESYMAAAGRTLRLSYFDHPPIAWWLTWAAEQLGGPHNDLVIRLPFIALFAVSTWLMFRLTAALFGECAGLWAAAALNAAPVLGIATGSWILPDGPLDAALLGGTLCFWHATRDERAAAWPAWIGAGLCFGLALCAKYTALPILLGLGAYLATTKTRRVWLARPQPYAAAALAFALLAPVLLWNAEHGFASFRFQGGRAFGRSLHPLGPVAAASGEALFFLPWLFVPLLILLWRAARTGPADPRSWLLVCLAAPSFLFFEIVSLQARVLPHWAAPALMLALPLLGAAIATRRQTSRALRFAMIATAITVTAGLTFVTSEIRYNWLPDVAEDFALGHDPDLAAVDWDSLQTELRQRDAFTPNLVIAATRWLDAGKIDFALRGEIPVLCLGNDPREYGIAAPLAAYAGRDVLILAPRETLASIRARFGAEFDRIEPVPPLLIRHAGKPAMMVPAFLGHELRAVPARTTLR